MAITRTAWIDDDGSGTTGTVINNAEKTALYDQIDAALIAGGPQGRYTVVGSTATGTVHDWAPGLNGHTVIRWNGSADLTITGIAGGTIGQSVSILNWGGSNLFLPWVSASSAAGNKFANFVSSGSTPVAPRGSATYVYTDIGGQNGWTMVAHEQGAWITPSYSAADYTAAAGTWTVEAGDVTLCQYRLSGRTLSVQLTLGTTSVSTAAGTLARAVPGGFTASAAANTPIIVQNAGAASGTGMARVIASAPLYFYADLAGNNWNIATNSTALNVNMTLAVT